MGKGTCLVWDSAQVPTELGIVFDTAEKAARCWPQDREKTIGMSCTSI